MSYWSRFKSIILSQDSGQGIRVGNASSDSFPFHDILGPIEVRGVGVTDPTWTQLGTSAFYAYLFAVNDVCWQPFHIPHDYAKGTDIYIHTHWTSNGTDANIVKWEYVYMYAHGHNQAAFNTTGTTINAQQAGSGTAWQHMVTETAAITISNMEPDGMLYVRTRRVTNGGTDNTDNIFVFTNDVHYQSTNIGTLNRSPNFYGT